MLTSLQKLEILALPLICSAVMEMNLVADSSYGSAMQASQQQLFFKEASDASYRAKGNLTPEQQVRARCPAPCCACMKCVASVTALSYYNC